MVSSLGPPAEEIAFADTYVRIALHDISAIAYIFGQNVAIEGALRVAQVVWSGLPPESRPSFVEFTKTHFTDMWSVTDERQPGLPAGCVSFLSHPRVRFDAPLYGAAGYPLHYILDARIPIGYRAIPSALFSPYAESNPQRNVAIRNRVSPVPLLFFDERCSLDDCLGIPIELDTSDGIRLLNGLYELELMKSRSSLKIKFDWPHYERSDKLDKQIRRSLCPSQNNLNRLATLTAGAVRNYMADERKVRKVDAATPLSWSIGTQPGEVSVRDVLLLGVTLVGDGAVMPLLASRIGDYA